MSTVTPNYGLYRYLLFLPSSQSQTLKRAFFVLTQLPLRALNLALYITSGTAEIKGHRKVCLVRCGGPTTLSKTNDLNLDCVFAENAIFYNDPR